MTELNLDQIKTETLSSESESPIDEDDSRSGRGGEVRRVDIGFIPRNRSEKKKNNTGEIDDLLKKADGTNLIIKY